MADNLDEMLAQQAAQQNTAPPRRSLWSKFKHVLGGPVTLGQAGGTTLDKNGNPVPFQTQVTRPRLLSLWTNPEVAQRQAEAAAHAQEAPMRTLLARMQIKQEEANYKISTAPKLVGLQNMPPGVYDPITGKYEAMDFSSPEKVKESFESALGKIRSPVIRGQAASEINLHMSRGDRIGAEQALEKAYARDATESSPAKVSYDQGIPVSVTDAVGVTYDINDPKLPAELAPLVKSAKAAHSQYLSEQATIQGKALANSLELFDAKQKALTTATRSMIEAAPGVLALAQHVKELTNQQVSSLGPGAGRWSEFWTGKVGAPNPEFTRLRTAAGLLQTRLMRMHLGSRGGQLIMAHFKDLFDVSKQSPENLLAAMDEVIAYANELQGERSGTMAPTRSMGTKTVDFNSLPK